MKIKNTTYPNKEKLFIKLRFEIIKDPLGIKLGS